MSPYFFGPSLYTLVFRYAVISGLKVFWWAINSGMTLFPRVILPYPWSWHYHPPLPFTAVDFTLTAIQLGLIYGAVQLVRSRNAPSAPALDQDNKGRAGPLDSNRISRSWKLTPVLLALLVIFSTCFVAWLAWISVVKDYRGTIPFLMFVKNEGRPALYVGLVLALLGLAFGGRFVSAAKASLGSNFDVKYLPPDNWLAQRVAALSQQLGIPTPAVGLIDVMNAFAMGTRNDAAVVIGLPLAKILTSEELDAVIGHELGHIVSNDMQRMQFAEGFQVMLGKVVTGVTTVGIAVVASQVRSSTNRRLAVGASSAVGSLVRRTVFISSELVVKGLSRSREYYADAVGAALTSQEAMIGALERIHGIPAPPTSLENRYGYLMFRGSKFGMLFSTHPALDRRVAALRDGAHIRSLPRTGPSVPNIARAPQSKPMAASPQKLAAPKLAVSTGVPVAPTATADTERSSRRPFYVILIVGLILGSMPLSQRYFASDHWAGVFASLTSWPGATSATPSAGSATVPAQALSARELDLQQREAALAVGQQELRARALALHQQEIDLSANATRGISDPSADPQIGTVVAERNELQRKLTQSENNSEARLARLNLTLAENERLTSDLTAATERIGQLEVELNLQQAHVDAAEQAVAEATLKSQTRAVWGTAAISTGGSIYTVTNQVSSEAAEKIANATCLASSKACRTLHIFQNACFSLARQAGVPISEGAYGWSSAATWQVSEAEALESCHGRCEIAYTLCSPDNLSKPE